jgi:hypothetical protein
LLLKYRTTSFAPSLGAEFPARCPWGLVRQPSVTGMNNYNDVYNLMTQGGANVLINFRRGRDAHHQERDHRYSLTSIRATSSSEVPDGRWKCAAPRIAPIAMALRPD